MPSTTPPDDLDVTFTTTPYGVYAHDHTTNDGCYGPDHAQALINLARKVEAHRTRSPADRNAVEHLLQ